MTQINKPSRRTILLAVVSIILLLIIQPAHAQVKSFRWENWESDITLQENGNFVVEETHTLEFSGEPFTFGYRTIRTGLEGGNDAIANIAVREGDINYTQSISRDPYTYTVSNDGDEITIRWYFPPALGQNTYTFTYTVEGGVATGVGQEGESDEIFWTIIPDDHPGLVSNSRAVIHLPQGVQPQRYTGTSDYIVAGYRNNNQSDDIITQVTDNGQTIIYENTQPLVEGKSFEVRTQFATGLLDIPTPQWQRQQQIGDTIGTLLLAISLLLLVGGPLLVLLLWYLKGRDPDLTVIVPEYINQPPDNLSPALVGTLVDEKADMQDIVSTLIDLANRGYLTMTEKKKDHLFTRTEKADQGLRSFESQMLKDFFGRKEERSLSDLRYKFAKKLPNLRKMIYQELVDEALVSTSPHSVRQSYGCFAGFLFGIALISFIVLTALFSETVSTVMCIPIALGITAFFMIFASRHMPRKTAKGAEAAAKWNAFNEYLKNIERHADLEKSSEIFAEYLAYAVAFGLERNWIRKFSSVPSTPIPGWYIPYYGGLYGGLGGSSSGGFGSGSPQMPTLEGMSGGLAGGLGGMSEGLTRMLNSTSTVLKSTPPSTSSGGSGGSFSGGFSGGGFSGGGGGSAGFG